MAKLSAQNKRMRELITEIKSRQVEALKGYRPTVVQQRFHASLAAERIARGGKRCQPDYTTVWMEDGTESTLAKVSIGDKIIGVRKYSSGKTFVRPTRIVDKKEFPESAYRLTTKRGILQTAPSTIQYLHVHHFPADGITLLIQTEKMPSGFS
jgi:hypothetical protein